MVAVAYAVMAVIHAALTCLLLATIIPGSLRRGWKIWLMMGLFLVVLNAAMAIHMATQFLKHIN
jgi:hypothetical protein